MISFFILNVDNILIGFDLKTFWKNFIGNNKKQKNCVALQSIFGFLCKEMKVRENIDGNTSAKRTELSPESQ